MNNFLITLNPFEQNLISAIGKLRYKNNRDNNIVDKKRSNLCNEQVDLDGFGGEYCMAKLMNVMPDFTINPRKGGYDLISHSGKYIDVKQTSHKNGNLIAVPWKVQEAIDIYTLVIGTFPSYEYVGYAFKGELITPENIKNLGYGETYFLSREKLHKELPI